MMRPWGGHALLLTSLAFAPIAFAQDSDVSGSVHDNAGTPLANISVVGLHHFSAGGMDEYRTKTDSQGFFKLKSVGRVFFFVAPKFQARTYIRKPGELSLDISLMSDVQDHWPATCSAGRESGKRYGSMFLFLVPPRTKLHHHHDTDTWDLLISFPGTKSAEHLTLWSGPMLGDGFVPEENILEATSFTQNEFDWRGKDSSGKNWRWFSSIQDLIHYESASDEAAHFFDRIIDSVCVKQPPVVSSNRRH